MINSNQIKKDFPLLSRNMNGNPLVYLDSASTTQKPLVVIEAINHYYRCCNANPHRGIYELAAQATDLYEQARETVAKFIKAQVEEIIFVRNTTEALNLIVWSWGWQNLKKDDEVIVSYMEHHSTIVPWQLLAQKIGCRLKFINLTSDGELDLNSNSGQSLKNLLSPKTKAVSLVHVSNVLGTVNPLHQIFKQVKQYNPQIICIADGAQSVPHLPVSVKQLQADFLAFSGHKMLGPMGIGVLWGKKDILANLPPFLGGGDMISEVYVDKTLYQDAPYRFEAGTANVAGAVGLAKAIEYLQSLGMNAIAAHEHDLLAYTMKQLRQIPEITILGPEDVNKRSGLISFTYQGVHAHDVASVLDSVGVAVRSGQHCAMPLHTFLHISASTRISLSIYNTKNDIDCAIEGLKKVNKIFSR